MNDKIERCGFCGRYFKGNKYLDGDFGDKPLGYCPEAEYEADPDPDPDVPRYITKDMAIDAGMPELEGMQW